MVVELPVFPTIPRIHSMWLTVPYGCALLLAVSFPVAWKSPITATDNVADEQLLQDALIATDGPGLLAFLRSRTLSDAAQEQIAGWIQQLGDPFYPVREQALARLVGVG